LQIVKAQSTNPQLEVESIQAQFYNSYLVPDLIATFDPIAYLTVQFGNGPVTAGTPLTVADVQTMPTVTATVANSSVSLDQVYTLAMVDPGPIGALSTPGPTRHWLVNGVTVSSSGAVTIPDNATTVTTYGAPLPAATDAPHRYAIVLWQQPSTFTAPADLAPPQPITQFDLTSYVSSSGLGPVVAGWYFTCTTGNVTAPTSTSAVNTATLPAASSGGGSSPTGSHTSTSTSTTHTNAALANVAVGPYTIAASLAAAIFGVVMA